MDLKKAKQATIEAIKPACEKTAANHYAVASNALGLNNTAPQQNFTQSPKM